MNLSERINLLLAEADKLRPLHEDDPKREPLGALIDEINELRAAQSVQHMQEGETEEDKTVAALLEDIEAAAKADAPKGKPGRPAKAKAAK